MKRIGLLLLSMAFMLVASVALGQGLTGPKVAEWSIVKVEGQAKAGETVFVEVKAKVDAPWHVYSTIPVPDGPFPTTYTVEGAEIVEPIEEQGLVKKLDPNFNKEVQFFERDVFVRIGLKLQSDALPEKLSVRYQACNDTTCIPPTSVELKIPGGVAMPSASAEQPVGEAATTPTNSVDKAKKQGLVPYLLLAISAGFLALLTPCVFPMVPITVSFFSKRKEDEGWKSGIKQALAYCGGIIGTFTLLGIGVSVAFGAAGVTNLANNAWLNLILAIVFIVLAFSLFGVFEIGVPSKWANKFDASGKSGLIAPIFMGLTFSLTSFTCTLPFVGAVLVAASQGEYLYPILGMMAFSTAFCIPFFLLALFPQALSKLPRSGAWLVTVKAAMGFVELMAAVKFLSTFDLGVVTNGLGLITREVFLATWFALLLGGGLYLLGAIRLPRVDDGKIGPARRVFGVLFTVASVYVVLGLAGRSVGELAAFLPPSPYPGREKSAKSEDGFYTSFEEAQAVAKAEGKPIFIDFTGIYCTNCRNMEANVFPTPEVQSQFNRFIKVKLMTDRNTPEDNKNQQLLQKLANSITLPTYVTLSTDGSKGVTEYTRDPKVFAQWLANAK